MKFVRSQAKDFHIVTPKITFNQPRGIKATEIVTTKSMDLVIMLGGFQLLMSFLRSIGRKMEGVGLKDALEEIRDTSTVPYLISGKAMSRALLDHFLVNPALVSQLM